MVTICAVRNFIWEALATKCKRYLLYEMISGKYVGRQQVTPSVEREEKETMLHLMEKIFDLPVIVALTFHFVFIY